MYFCISLYIYIKNYEYILTLSISAHHRFVLASSLCFFEIAFSNSEKPGSHYPQYIYLFAQSWYIQKVVSELLTHTPVKNKSPGTSLVVQWVRLHAPSAGGLGSTPGRGTRSCTRAATKSLHAATKILHAATKTQHSLNK